MTTHTADRVLPYPPEAVFDLVADVESYPEFLPFWRQAEIYQWEKSAYYTEQEIHMGLLRERFRTKTVLHRPTRIDVTSSEGLFHDLAIRWGFEPTRDGGCRVNFVQSWRTKSVFLDRILDIVLIENALTTMGAFEKRAHALYDVSGAHSEAFAQG